MCLHTDGTHETRLHRLFSPHRSGALRGEKVQLALVAVFPETGLDAGQATLNSSAGFIVVKVDRVRSRPPLLCNTRTLLVSDMEQTLAAAQTNPCHAL